MGRSKKHRKLKAHRCPEQGCTTITLREKCAKHLTADVIRKAARPDKALN